MSDRPEKNRQELQSALDAVATSFKPSRPVSPSAAPPAAVPTDGKQELATAYDKLVEHEATKPTLYLEVAGPWWHQLVRPAIIFVCVAAAIYLTVAEPAWLYPPFDAPAAPTSEAGAEQVLVATSLLVQQYQAEFGRLPGKISDIKGSFPSVSLLDTGAGGYQLFAPVGTKSVVMTVGPGQEAVLQGGSR